MIYLYLPAIIFAASSPLVRPGQDTKTKHFFPSQLNMSAPSSPAVDILGVATSQVKSASNLQDLASTLINSFDEAGHLKQGIALATSFKKLGIDKIRDKDTYSTYFGNMGRRLHWATNLSFAAIKGDSTDDPSARAAIGLAFPLIDHTDWRANKTDVDEYNALVADAYSKPPERARVGFAEESAVVWRKKKRELEEVLGFKFDTTTPQHVAEVKEVKNAVELALEAVDVLLPKLDAGVDPKQTLPLREKAAAAVNKVFGGGDANLWDKVIRLLVEADFSKQFDKFVANKNADNWNKKKLDVSVAHSWFAADAANDSLRKDGFYAWGAYSDAVGKSSEITLFARFATKDRSFDKVSKTWNIGNSRSYGASFRHQDGAFIEYVDKEITMGSSKKHETLWQGGYEIKMAGEQWLQISLGRGNGSGTTRNIFGVNWTFNLSPTSELKANKPPTS